MLPNGKVLLVAGVDNSPNGGVTITNAELYDPGSGTWSDTGFLMTARAYHTATLLPNGKVMVAGGYSHISGYVPGVELYDPASGTWSTTGSLHTARSLSLSDIVAQRQGARCSGII